MSLQHHALHLLAALKRHERVVVVAAVEVVDDIPGEGIDGEVVALELGDDLVSHIEHGRGVPGLDHAGNLAEGEVAQVLVPARQHLKRGRHAPVGCSYLLVRRL